MRVESDIHGSRELDDDCMYGLQTLRALENFPVSQRRVHRRLIRAMIQVKKAAAVSYQQLLFDKKEVYQAIESACDEVLAGKYEEMFCTDALQGGAGTSTHMNVNEVLANLALVKLGHSYGEYQYVHPLDDAR